MRTKRTKKTRKGKVSTKSASTKSTKKALKAIGAEMSAVLNADAFGVGVPKVKKVRKTTVERAIAAMGIAEPTAPVQEVVEQVVAIPDVLLLHVGAGKKHEPVVIEAKKDVTSPAAVVARVARVKRTLASKMGSELVRYLRIHTKHPYGRRGEQAIVDMACEIAHMGNLELDAVSA